MSSNFNKLNLLAYIHNPVSIDTMLKIYSTHNIFYDKCELYGDFTLSLLELVFTTYLGDELTTNEQQFKHFDWCWKKTIDNFEKEEITINGDKLYQYFLEFTLELFYLDPKKDENLNKSLTVIWANIFDYEREKTNADIDTLLELYKIFENSLKKTF